MQLEHLREFVILAETLNFSRASQLLFISPSVLSKHIASLEHDLGAGLFVRDAHHVRLTKQGESFLRDIRVVLGSYDKAIQNIEAVNQSLDRSISIGYLRSAAQPFLLFLKTWFLEHAPQTRVDLQCMEYGDLMKALAANSVDFALAVDIDWKIVERYESYPIYDDAYCLVLNKNHALAEEENADIGTVRAVASQARHVILPDPDSYRGIHEFAQSLFTQECRESALYYRDIETLIMSVEVNEGVAVASGHHRFTFGERVRFLPLTDASRFHVSALWAKDLEGSLVDLCMPCFKSCSEYMRQRLGSA